MSLTPTPLPSVIVLVDDEEDARIILSRMLAYITDSYECIAVDSGAAALSVLATRPVVLLFTDYHMPGMNGLELTQQVRAVSPTTKIVMLSAYASPELARDATAAGADNTVSKPFQFDQLQAIVREALA